MNKIIEVEALADVHTHLREGKLMRPLIHWAFAGGADVLGAMPNTKKGLTTASAVLAYLKQAYENLPLGRVNLCPFLPFVMITENTTKRDIDECVKAYIRDAKIYPYQRTVHSTNGVSRYGKLLPIIKHCGDVGMKVHFHPEHPWMVYGNREAEFAFLPIAKMFLEETAAFIFWEHGSDARCIPFWEEMAGTGRFFLTLTAHHLVSNEDRAFGDVRSVCKSPLKTERDRRDLVDLVAKDYPWIMAAGDSAYHREFAKHVNKGNCACGTYTGPFLHQLYAHALDKMLETKKGVQIYVNFTSRNARKIHELPESSRTVKLVREEWQIPMSYTIGKETVMPFWTEQEIKWKLVS